MKSKRDSTARRRTLLCALLCALLCSLAACRTRSTLPPEAALVPAATQAAPTPTPVATATQAAPTQTPEPSPEPTRAPAFTPSFEQAPCPMDLPPGAVEGRDIWCGYVTVPERHAAPEGPTIRLAVAVIPASSEAPQPDPLLMLSGGPGESALTAFPPLLALPGFNALWAERDVVLIEQRGTKYATPFLQCANMLDVKLEILAQNLDETEEDALRLQA